MTILMTDLTKGCKAKSGITQQATWLCVNIYVENPDRQRGEEQRARVTERVIVTLLGGKDRTL
jgi:hypothetical protein